MSAGRVDKAWEILQAQQASMATATSVQKARLEKELEKDLILAEESHVSAIIAPPSTDWTAPQLVKSDYTGQTPATEAAKEMAKLPPPPPAMQHYWSAYFQMKGTPLPPEAYVGGKAPSSPPAPSLGLDTLGEAEFAKISAAIHKESTSLISQSLEEAQEQQNVAMQKLEEISSTAADLENLTNSLQELEILLEQYKIDGHNSSALVGHIKSILAGISDALKGGDVRYTAIITTNHWRGPYRTIKDITNMSELLEVMRSKGAGAITMHNLKPSIGPVLQKILAGPANAQNYFFALKQSLLSAQEHVSQYAKLVRTYEGSLRNKFVIPAGHTATFMKNFPEPTYIVLTNANGTKEIAYNPTAKVTKTFSWKTSEHVPGYWTTQTHRTVANIFTYFCKQHGLTVPPQPANRQSYVNRGSIGKIPAQAELVYQKGLLLCQLMGYTGTSVTPDQIQAALEIAKELQLVLKKLMEAYYDQGNGLAVFTAYQNALSQGQQRNQQVIAATEQNTADLNMQMLNQMQSYVQHESQILVELDKQTTIVDADQATLSRLSAISTDLSYASYAMLGLSIAAAIGSFFTGGLLSLVSIGIDVGSATIGLTTAGLQIAMGVDTMKLGNDSVVLANLQKQYAGAQEYVQETVAHSNLTSQMASTTTTSLQEIVQQQIAIEKDVMSMYDAASQAITSSSQA